MNDDARYFLMGSLTILCTIFVEYFSLWSNYSSLLHVFIVLFYRTLKGIFYVVWICYLSKHALIMLSQTVAFLPTFLKMFLEKQNFKNYYFEAKFIFFFWEVCDIFLMIRIKLCKRKIAVVKSHFHHVVLRVRTIAMTYHCWWCWSPGEISWCDSVSQISIPMYVPFYPFPCNIF